MARFLLVFAAINAGQTPDKKHQYEEKRKPTNLDDASLRCVQHQLNEKQLSRERRMREAITRCRNAQTGASLIFAN